ncbi:MAG: hypothetical protein JOZ47_18315 [Kutzneria sp.]|nr:hypothetical protein [Kutzneria sp.]
MTVLLDDGQSVEADVPIAADGINSAVRAQQLSHVRVIDLDAGISWRSPADRPGTGPDSRPTAHHVSLAYYAHHTG